MAKVVITPFLEADGQWTCAFAVALSKSHGYQGFGPTRKQFHYAVAEAALEAGREAQKMGAASNGLDVEILHMELDKGKG